MNKEIEKALNSQLNFEIESAHIYLAMAGYASSIGLDGFENWYMVQYEEELAHAKKFINYMNDRGARVKITGFDDPNNTFESILDTLEISLNHEKKVTKRINDLMDLAQEKRDHATVSLLHWYVDEQVEEEDNFNNLIDKVKLVKDAGLYILDKELETRTFVPINTEEK